MYGRLRLSRPVILVRKIYMFSKSFQIVSIFVFGLLLACSSVSSSGIRTPSAGEPEAASVPAALPGDKQTAVFAGGCFWGVEAVFEHIKGVSSVTSGYAGGTAKRANYDAVSGGSTGHAESVLVTFDPAVVTYEQLLDVFFKVAHNPTELNRQGPDVGTQYRSAIFYTSENQKTAALGYIEKLGTSGEFKKPIVTQVVPLEKFFEAEAYHQDYLPQNLDSPYIINHDLPKLENLKDKFPGLYVKK
jgi:peptide-methionine (S)-S-oxide reductase